MSFDIIPKFRVAIIGYGIGGLALAVALTRGRRDIKVDIYEAVAHPSDIELDAGIWRMPIEAISGLGLGEIISATDVRTDEHNRVIFEMRKSDQPHGALIRRSRIPSAKLLLGPWEFKRSLESKLKYSTVHLHCSKNLQSYTEPKSTSYPIVLYFTDGTSTTCDVLIGADGTKSVTRHQMFNYVAEEFDSRRRESQFRRLADPIFTGSVIYRTSVANDQVKAVMPSHRIFTTPMLNYIGTDKHIVLLAVPHHQRINVSIFISNPFKEGDDDAQFLTITENRRRLVDKFKSWEPEILQILELVDMPVKCAPESSKDIPIYAHRRVALLGDAVHAAPIHQSSGAAFATEDAYILGALLSHPLTTLNNVPLALKIYQEVRLPRGKDNMTSFRKIGQLFELSDSSFQDLRNVNVHNNNPSDRSRLDALGKAIEEEWVKAWKVDPDEDQKTALALLEQRAQG